MARKYTHIKMMEEEMVKLKEEGKTKSEIAEQFGLSKEQVKNWISRYNRSERKKEAGVLPRRPGRQPNGFKLPEQEKDYEIKRLKIPKWKSSSMENRTRS